MRLFRIATFGGAVLVGGLGVFALPHIGSGQVPVARTSPDSVRYSIALLTVGPGSAPASWFGHSALIVDDGARGGARIYGYGSIPRGARTMRAAINGRIIAYTTSVPAREEFERLARGHRTMRIQPISVAPAAARRLVSKLEMQTSRLPLSYGYDALRDNCSTRIRDLIDEATGGKLRIALAASSTSMTLREAGIRAMGGYRPRTALVDLMVGSAADAPASEWELSAFPPQLADAVAHMTASVPAGPSPRSLLLFGIVAGLSTVGAAVFLRRSPRAARVALGGYSTLVGIVLGIPGLLIAGASLVGSHSAMLHNANIVLANPLTFLALPLGALCCINRGNAFEWLSRLWSLLAIIAIAGAGFNYAIAQEPHNTRIVALLLPILICNVVAFRVALPIARRASAVRNLVLISTP